MSDEWSWFLWTFSRLFLSTTRKTDVGGRHVPGKVETDIASNGIPLSSKARLARRQCEQVSVTNNVIRPIFYRVGLVALWGVYHKVYMWIQGLWLFANLQVYSTSPPCVVKSFLRWIVANLQVCSTSPQRACCAILLEMDSQLNVAVKKGRQSSPASFSSHHTRFSQSSKIFLPCTVFPLLTLLWWHGLKRLCECCLCSFNNDGISSLSWQLFGSDCCPKRRKIKIPHA